MPAVRGQGTSGPKPTPERGHGCRPFRLSGVETVAFCDQAVDQLQVRGDALAHLVVSTADLRNGAHDPGEPLIGVGVVARGDVGMGEGVDVTQHGPHSYWND